MSDPVPFRNASAAALANQLARLFAKALAEAVAPHGLAPAQFMVLLELWKTDGLKARDLVRRLDVEQATMANTLNRMGRDGLVVREPDPRDSRASRIKLTDKARELKKPAKAAVRAVNARALGGLSRKEEDRFFDLLQRVSGTLREERDRARDDGVDAAAG